jgi:hypothetical protein
MFATLQLQLPSIARSSPAAAATLHPTRGAIALDDKQFVSLSERQGWSVRAVSGSVWVTQDWDRRDIVLEAGQDFVFDGHGGALISALGPARICIAAA